MEAMSAVHFQPLVHLAMGLVEALNGTQGFIPVPNQVFEERRDLAVSMLNQARASDARSPRARSMSILPVPAPRQDVALGKVIENDEDFVTELLETEGVAVVQGSAFGLGPGVPDFLRHQDQRSRRRLQTHPALLRQFAIEAFSSEVESGSRYKRVQKITLFEEACPADRCGTEPVCVRIFLSKKTRSKHVRKKACQITSRDSRLMF